MRIYFGPGGVGGGGSDPFDTAEKLAEGITQALRSANLVVSNEPLTKPPSPGETVYVEVKGYEVEVTLPKSTVCDDAKSAINALLGKVGDTRLHYEFYSPVSPPPTT